MLNYSKLSKKPRVFHSFTGITPKQFDFLSQKIKSEYKDAEKKRLSKKKRERDIGAGHLFKLSVKNRILMCLMYYRMYTIYELIGFLFGLDQSNVYRNIRYLEPAVKQSIPIPAKKYADSKKLKSLEDIQKFFPELCNY